MVAGNLVRSLEDGEIHPSAGSNDSGDGVTIASLEQQEIEDMHRRLRELEEPQQEIPIAAAVAAAATTASHVLPEDPAAAATDAEKATAAEKAIAAEKAEVDARSIYVGNVDYACLPEDLQQHFQDCGTVNRVTILTDDFGQPKGFAYVEFLEVDAVQNALQLNETELYTRALKVCPKRTNIPGMNQFRGRRPFNPYYPTYGKVPRFRRSFGFYPY